MDGMIERQMERETEEKKNNRIEHRDKIDKKIKG